METKKIDENIFEVNFTFRIDKIMKLEKEADVVAIAQHEVRGAEVMLIKEIVNRWKAKRKKDGLLDH